MQQFINSNANKVPFDPATGRNVDHLNPANWLSYEQAQANAAAHGCYVSWVLAKGTGGLWCLDIDKAVDDSGQLNDIARELVQLCINYPVLLETSCSGRGLHIWGRYDGQFPQHRKKLTELGIELYTDERHIVLGVPQALSPVPSFPQLFNTPSCNDLLLDLVVDYFNPIAAGGEQWNDLSQWVAEDPGLTMEAIKRRKCASASNPFSGALSLVDLLTMDQADWEAGDKSSADMALLNHLAFHTGRNHAAMERLYRTSNVGQFRAAESPCKLDRNTGRDCQGRRVTYLQRSILRAAAECQDVYLTPKEHKEAKQAERVEELRASVEGDRGTPDSPAGYYLRDFVCIYNDQAPTFYDTRSGNELGKTCFKDAFRVDCFEFEQAFPERILAGKTYGPGLPPIYTDEMGSKILNTWRPGPVPMEPSATNRAVLDAYFDRVFVDPQERQHILQWCGHLVQRPKVKILHALLIHGYDNGTGKSTLGMLLSKALGTHNVARISNHTLKDPYNDWLSRSMFGWSDEVNTSKLSDYRREMITEQVKEWVTNRDMPIRAMYKSTTNDRNNINGFLFTANNDDALYVDERDRRFFVVNVEMNMAIRELIATDAFTWISSGIPDGEIAGYFSQVDISDFNPNARAPETAAKANMIEATKDDLLVRIQQAMEDPTIAEADDSLVFPGRLAERLDVSPKAIGAHLRRLGFHQSRVDKLRYWSKQCNLTREQILTKGSML